MNYLKLVNNAEINAMSEWISVNERLPEEYGRYLIFCDYGKYDMPGGLSKEMGIFQPSDKSWTSLETGSNNCITDWQPLPSNPRTKHD